MAGETLMRGEISLEVVQAFILLSLYSYASETDKTRSDRSWMLLGVAIRSVEGRTR